MPFFCNIAWIGPENMPRSPGSNTFTRTLVSSTSIAVWTDAEVQLVAGPAGFDLCSTRNVVLKLVDVAGDTAPRLVLAEGVGQFDFDGL